MRLLSQVAALALVAATCWPQPATAQVMRCTDAATGKVTYTDGACHRGDAVREVEGRKTAEDIAQERQQAAEALERKQERQQQEARQRRDAEQAERAARNAQPLARSDPAQSAQCQRARQNLQQVLASMGQGMYDEQTRLDAAQRQADLACLSPADYARAERSRSQRAEYSAPYLAAGTAHYQFVVPYCNGFFHALFPEGQGFFDHQRLSFRLFEGLGKKPCVLQVYFRPGFKDPFLEPVYSH